jgi:FKBP-type peptidyl-prolyl cis-trans isomerase FklB
MNRRLLLTGLVAFTGLAAVACKKKPAAASPAEAAFLVENGKKPGVITLPDGLQYKILASGPATGVKPGPEDEVKVHYEGKLINGEVFDSSYDRGQPAVFGVKILVPAWVEALQMMRPGDMWELYVPAKLGYGDMGQGPIPPGATLIFKMELLDVLTHAAPHALV